MNAGRLPAPGTKEKRPSKGGPLVTIGLGLFCLLKGVSPLDAGTISIGIAVTVGGIVWFTGLRPTYTVHITTASGDKEALRDQESRIRQESGECDE